MHLIWYWLGFLPSICLPITAFVLSLIYLHRRKRDNLPPGPFAWPVLGNLLSLRSNSTAALEEIRITYGDVYSLYFGSRLVVVVNGKAVEECLSTRSAKFSMRPELFTAQYVLGGKSFAFSHMDVETHRRYRKLAVGVVKELLVSTHERSQPTTKEEINPISPHSIEDQIYAQAKQLCVGLFDIYASNSKSGQLDIREEIMRRISFEMCGLASETILGKKLWEHELADLSELVEDLRNSNDATLILNFIPISRYLWKEGLRKYIKINQDLNNFFSRCFDRRNPHVANGSDCCKSEETCDVLSGIDCVLKLWQQLKDDPQFEENRVMKLVGDLFGANVDTMTVALAWMIVYWSTYHQAQTRAQEEIDRFVETNLHLPRYSDRSQLPFVMALITEVARHCSFVPFALPHAPVEDTTLNGYLIPSGTVMMISMRSVNHDHTLWDSPGEFRPERFISSETGVFNKALADRVMLFGGGRRRCAGEALARMQLFLFSVSILRSCTIRRVDHSDVLPDALPGISLIPKNMYVSIVPRKRPKC